LKEIQPIFSDQAQPETLSPVPAITSFEIEKQKTNKKIIEKNKNFLPIDFIILLF
jgi:hypothetical protein